MKDQEDFDELIVAHLDYLYQFAFRLTGCRQTAEDIVQDLFVNLKPRDIDFTYVKNKKAWLGTVLYRTFVKHWRKEKRSPFSVESGDEDRNIKHEAHDYVACEQPGPEEQISNENLQDTLVLALSKLNDEQRVLVIMHDVEGYTLQELQQIMDVPLGTLKSRLHRARNKLQSILEHRKISSYASQTLEKCIAHEL